MSKKKWNLYLDIPEGSSGDVHVKHAHKPAGHVFETSNLRTSFFGQRPKSISFDEPTRWHLLEEEDHGLWMTDYPIEQAQHDALLKNVSGPVLVGGLGIGYAATMLARRRSIPRVTVVERSADIIRLVEPHLKVPRGKLEIIEADLFDYLKAKPMATAFDWAFYDIWQSDGEGTFFKVVIPLRELSEARWVPPNRVICWNEDVMRGQLKLGLQSRLMFSQHTNPNVDTATLEELSEPKDGDGDIWWNWSVPFFRWVRSLDDFQRERFSHDGIVTYGDLYGTYKWTERWERFAKLTAEW